MTKETFFSLLRAVLTLGGSYLIGKTLLGTTVDQNWLLVVIGGAVTLGSTIWGIFDKTIGSEQLASALRSVVMSVGMIFVASGKLSSNALEQISLIVVTLIPVILSQTSKSTIKQVAEGTVVPEIKKGTEPPNMKTVFTGSLVREIVPVEDKRAKTEPIVKS